MKRSSKKFIKVLSVALAAVLALPIATGCKKKKEGANVLEIFCWKAGYGTQWCIDMYHAFENEDWVKEKYPDLEIVYSQNDSTGTYITQIDAGEGVNTMDLIFSGGVSSYTGMDGEGHEFFSELSEKVYNAEIPGEDGVTVMQKMFPTYVDSVRYYERGQDSNSKDEIPFKSYVFPWASGMDGILYNREHLETLGLEVPLTTTQFVETCEAIQNSKALAYLKKPEDQNGGAYAILKDAGGAYWNYLYPIWWGQYEGINGYYNFFNGVIGETEEDYQISAEVFKQQGKKHALQAMEDILLWDNGYFYKKSTGLDHEQAQQAFLLGDGVFYANGDWFAKEMEKQRNDAIQFGDKVYDIRMMKTPIISQIIEKTPSITNDEELRVVIRAIDKGFATLSAATDAVGDFSQSDMALFERMENSSTGAKDYKKIVEARSIVHAIGPNHHAVVPSYALGKEIAYDFLLFMATDKAQEIYMNATGGASLPFDYDVETKNPDLWASFDNIEKDRLTYINKAKMGYETNVLPDPNSFPLVKYGGMSAVESMGGYSVIAYFSAEGQSKGAALTLFNDDIATYVDGGKFDTCRNKAGLGN